MWGTQCVEDEKTPCTVCYLGEFGEVYKAHLIKWHGMGMPRVVAVKTLKGAEFCRSTSYQDHILIIIITIPCVCRSVHTE